MIADLGRAARIVVLSGLALLLPVEAASANEACKGLLKRFNRLIDLYHEAGARAIADGQDPPKALEAARARALGGEPQATVTLVGVTLLIYGRRDVFPVTIIRQVCNLAAKHALPLHVVSCAYFNALNPLGDRQEKRRAVDVEIARFAETSRTLPANAGEVLPEYQEHVDALKACLPGGGGL